jgi:hypothetical protein
MNAMPVNLHPEYWQTHSAIMENPTKWEPELCEYDLSNQDRENSALECIKLKIGWVTYEDDAPN